MNGIPTLLDKIYDLELKCHYKATQIAKMQREGRMTHFESQELERMIQQLHKLTYQFITNNF